MFKEEVADVLDDLARPLGLYVEGIDWAVDSMGQEVCVATFILGDVAFSDRVQAPQRHATNSMVGIMEKQLQGDTFLDMRERLRLAIAEGRDVLGVE